MGKEKTLCQKKAYQKVGFELKLAIIDEIQNGRISINYASKKHNISRSSITYWMRKYSRLEQRKQGMSMQYEIKRLKERIEELEFIKEFQQDIIIDLEDITGLDIAKKSLPETLAKELAKRKRDRSK